MRHSLLALMTGGSFVVAALWTVLTGQWWHWIAVVAAYAMVYGFVRSTENGS